MIDSISDQAGAGSDLKKSRRRSSVSTERLPPHSLEAEQGVLSCCLQSPEECVGDAIEFLRGDLQAFYDARHQAIFHALTSLHEARTPIDIISVQLHLRQNGLLEQIGGIPYLNELQNISPSPANLTYYLDQIREQQQLRKWIALCTNTVGEIYENNGTGKVEDLVARVSTELFQLCESGLRTAEKTMREVITDVSLNVLEKFVRGRKHKIGPMTGFNYLDNILPGLGRGQLIVEAARPRTGKTAKMMQTAEWIAGVEKIPVAVFSLEMTATSLGTRAIFQRAGADLTKFLNGFMSDTDVQKLVVAGDQLMKMPLYIDESPRLAIEDLEIRARRLVRRYGVQVIFIDYFQLLYVRNRHRQWSKADELGECSMRLKGLAKELNVPIYLCAQMNREIEKETHRRPRLSDLKDTGQLEQDADVVMFLWKPDIQNEKWKDKIIPDILARAPVQEDWRTPNGWKKNLAIVMCTVEKQREGRSGEDAIMLFIKPWTRFVDAYRPPKVVSNEPEPRPEPEPELEQQEMME